jgi:hypothetical protein
MSVSRRKFLRSGALISAALVLNPGTFVLGQSSPSPNSSNPARRGVNGRGHYRREMFEPFIGDVFRVRVGKHMFDLKLVALEDFSHVSHGITTGRVARTDSFSLQFHTAKPLPSHAGIHNLNHKELGSFQLFLSQSEVRVGFLQTAIVNHLA